MDKLIEFFKSPAEYRHWTISYEGALAWLDMDVDELGGLREDYELKLNSYDLGVDIELADIVQRMRFEQPQIRVVVMRSAKEKVFCAGANIRMLGSATHEHKVNFCKFTNETRNTFEAAGVDSAQHYIAAVRGACAGGGYELALACNEIYMVDDGSTTVSLPEVPLLAVLPGTGGLTRLTDKRKVRRDLADVFCSLEEGVKGKRAKQWNLVDDVIANTRFDEFIKSRAEEIVESATVQMDDSKSLVGIQLNALEKASADDGSIAYSHLKMHIDRAMGRATVTLLGPSDAAPESVADLHSQGADSWMMSMARQLDDVLLHLRFNETEIGVVLFKSSGDLAAVVAHENSLLQWQSDDWLSAEILLYWKRVLKRLDLMSRSLVALVENGSCFAGVLADILFAVDRSYMMEGEFEDDERPEAAIELTTANFGPLPMSNDLTRLQTRFLGNPSAVDAIEARIGEPLRAEQAVELGLVTFAFDDIDWFDEVRIFLEERASFSPDAMTAMEANLRFAGPETMETRIFGRLTAWQNWVFQRPNAVGENGALQRYGSGSRAEFDRRRV